MQRKSLSLSILILGIGLVFQSASSQSLNTNGMWRQNSMTLGLPSNPNHVWEFTCYIDDTAVIAGNIYHKVYRYGIHYLTGIPNPSTSTFNNDLYGYLREENGRWYTNLNGEDTLVYDFNLEIGDTVFNAFTPDNVAPVIIVSNVDSILIGNNYHRRLHLGSNIGASYIIEGIGSDAGLFEILWDFEWSKQLICYAENGISLWGASNSLCDLTVDVDEMEEMESSLTVYPNPATDHIWISLMAENMMNESCALQIFNSSGQLCMEESEVWNGNKIKLDVSSLRAGLYLIHISGDGHKPISKRFTIRSGH